VRAPGVAFNELPHIDFVFISHNHYDHLSLPTLKRLSDKFHPLILVPLGLQNLLESHGIQRVKELDWWQTYSVKNVVITFLPTQHWSQRGLGDRYKTLWGSYGINYANKHIYYAGDSGYSSHFKEIRQKWGKPDLAFLPIGSYQPEWFMRENHMNPREAVNAHQDLQALHTIGIHFGTFQLSDEAIDQPIIDLNNAKLAQKLAPDDFITLENGQSLVY
jgi:L-ascorbate metabolism protein UlaG (beta-lactamase superfamily)